MKLKDLKPCPFCGRKPAVTSFRSDGIDYFSFHCTDGACMCNRCEYDASSDIEKETKMWNQRKEENETHQ